MAYIVELEKGVFLAHGEGDPCRTLDQNNAKQFHSKSVAKRVFQQTKGTRAFNNFQIIEVKGGEQK